MTKLVARRVLQYPYQINEYVSVKGSQGWGYVCFDSLNAHSSNVICRSTQQKFGTRTRAVALPVGDHIIYSGTFNCSGSEMSLRECNVSLEKTDLCKKRVAVVDCTAGSRSWEEEGPLVLDKGTAY